MSGRGLSHAKLTPGLALLGLVPACGDGEAAPDREAVPIELTGSLQNPCWSPDGTTLAVTAFGGGYNVGPSRIALVAATGGAARVLVAGADNVNLPVCWNAATDTIVFSSDVEARDEVWTMRADGSARHRVTDRPGAVAFEPSLSPDGGTIVFESHVEGDDRHGTLWTVRADGSGLTQLTSGSDDRQPVWSPLGDRIVFQSDRSGNLDVWTMSASGGELFNVTAWPSEDTDPSWSPDGARIVFSSDHGDLELGALFVIPVGGGTPERVTAGVAYEGAPAWSPDGSRIAFESRGGDPDGSSGTRIHVVAAPHGPTSSPR